MAHGDAFVLVPLIGYGGLWCLGIGFFLVYFKIFWVVMDLKHTVAMIRKVPVALSVA